MEGWVIVEYIDEKDGCRRDGDEETEERAENRNRKEERKRHGEAENLELVPVCELTQLADRDASREEGTEHVEAEQDAGSPHVDQAEDK